ncbi:MAG: class II fructose-bisphosphate aldolase [Thermoguttaceae bacterium]|jgi:fructose/tagatose bisphosphate aldolase
MPLEPAAQLLTHARRNRFAVGYFESWDVASLEGVIDAAEQVRAPIIIGFNGEFLSRGDRCPPVRLDWYGTLARAAAESAKVPCAAMFNECPLDGWVEHATRAGFNLVMLADAAASYGDLARRVTELVDIAHPRGVAVEAELGLLPSGTGDHGDAAGSLTDPELAAAFVRETGVDALAISAGNVHVLLDGQRELDLPHLAAIAQQVDVPLVLHGGSGIEPNSLGKAIGLGVAKVNYGTYLKQRCLAAWRRALAAAQTTPHQTLGNGGEADLIVIGRRAVREAVLQRIGALGCCGRA